MFFFKVDKLQYFSPGVSLLFEPLWGEMYNILCDKKDKFPIFLGGRGNKNAYFDTPSACFH
jgi:hypothetical protein